LQVSLAKDSPLCDGAWCDQLSLNVSIPPRHVALCVLVSRSVGLEELLLRTSWRCWEVLEVCEALSKCKELVATGWKFLEQKAVSYFCSAIQPDRMWKAKISVTATRVTAFFDIAAAPRHCSSSKIYDNANVCSSVTFY
jgi:hypothetical protein